MIRALASAVRKRCGDPIYPRSGESLALSTTRPKTAALAFDRVYRIPIMTEPVPNAIGFYGATTPELIWCSYALYVSVATQLGFEVQGLDTITPKNPADNERRTLYTLCSELGYLYGRLPTLFFHNEANIATEFQAGSKRVLYTAISQIALVDEDELSWEQVTEFRLDKDARIKYRRMVRWIDDELRHHTPAEVEDFVALRLDDYEWALKKHGISTMLGTLSSLIDAKFIGTSSAIAAAAALSGEKLWGALMGLSVVVGKAVVTFGTSQLTTMQERRAENYEVAYIHEIKRITRKSLN